MEINKIEEKRERKKEKTKQIINVFLIRYFKWLIVFSVLVVLALGYILLIKPKYQQVTQLAKDGQAGKEQEYLQRREYLDKIKNLIRVFQGVKASDIKKVNYILEKKDGPEELFTQIESIVKKNGLLLISLKIESAEPGSKESPKKISRTEEETAEPAASLPPEIEKMKGTLKILGVDYFSLKSLLTSIENNLMIMDVVNLDFNPEGNSAQLIFYTYYLKQ